LDLIYIIADDLTGASDTGVQFKRIGLRTAISAEINIDVLEKLYEKFEVISINADTRSLMPEEAYAQTFNLTKRIGTNANEYIYKKVDSLMRGNAAEELQAVMDARLHWQLSPSAIQRMDVSFQTAKCCCREVRMR
jgi:uncharacterized protein YgbK (DUF1537 family)